MKGVYEKFQALRQRKNKANLMVHSSWFIVHSQDKESNLKKQSQFAGGANWRKVLIERKLWQ